MSDDSEHPQPPSKASHADGSLDFRPIEQLLAEIRDDDLTDDLTLPHPPSNVWAKISGQLAPATDQPHREHRSTVDGAVRDVDDLDRTRPTRQRPDRRVRQVSRWVVLSAAASVIAIVVVSFALFGERGNGDQVGSGPIISTAVLAYDPARFDPRGAGASATAELIEQGGTYSIQLVDVDLPTVRDRDLELWLIQPDAEGNPLDVAPVALVHGTGPYVLPAGLDPTSHFVVDISIEPRDGDVSHSGASILRGSLT